MRRGFHWLFLCVVLAAPPAEAQEPLGRARPEAVGLDPDKLAQISDLVDDFVQQQIIAGGVVGIARRGRIAYLRSSGVQDLETGVPMSERSLFRIYSMTKSVTAVAVMILHDEGHFELSDPVSDFLPQFAGVMVLDSDGSTRPPARAVTIEDLLTHTAGLSHRSSPEYREAAVRSRAITLPEFIDNIVQVPLRDDPGARYMYSAAPTVLGRLVEVWSGESFDDFVADRILEPLGMDDTSWWVNPADVSRLTTVYNTSEERGLQAFLIEEVPFTQHPALIEGSVGLVSTVPDFLRFSQMLLNGGELGGDRILRRDTGERFTQNRLSDEILRTRRGGAGWALANVRVVMDPESDEPGAHVGEYRWDGSAGTEFWVDPATETIVITAWQSAPANPEGLRQRIRALVREAIRN